MSSTTAPPLPTFLRYILPSTSIPSPLPLHLLPAESRAPVTRFYRLSDKKLALGSQLLQRLLICQTHQSVNPNITLQSVSLSRDPESSRPIYLVPEGTPEPKIIDYNVSHHSGLVVLAALLPSTTSPPTATSTPPTPRRIGVDVVATTLPPRTSSPQEYLHSFITPSAAIFTAREIATIHSPPTWPLRIRLFYMHWALKEAYVKATGTGLVTDLTQIEFRGVRLFDVEDPGCRRFTGTRLFLGGVEQLGWYLEVEAFEGGDGGDGEGEGEGEGEGLCYIAVATEREGLSEEDLRGEWKVVDVKNDIEVWDGTRR